MIQQDRACRPQQRQGMPCLCCNRFTGPVKHFPELKLCSACLVSLLNQLLTKKFYHEKNIVFRIDPYPCFYSFCVSAGD